MTDQLWGHHILCRKKHRGQPHRYCSDCDLIQQTIEWLNPTYEAQPLEVNHENNHTYHAEPKTRRHLTDEYLTQVIEAYHAALNRGEHPAPTIAKDLGVSVHTARAWIKIARKRGLMPPGRKGHPG